MVYIVKKKTKSGTSLYDVEAIWNTDNERADGTHAPVRPKPVQADVGWPPYGLAAESVLIGAAAGRAAARGPSRPARFKAATS